MFRFALPLSCAVSLLSAAALHARDGTLRPACEVAIVSAAVETVSIEENLALEAFCNRAEGVSGMAKMQPFVAVGMIGPEMQEAQMRIGTRLMTELSSQ